MALSARDVPAINAVTKKCTQAVRDHDPEAYLQNCTDDVVFLPPGEPDVVGSGAVKRIGKTGRLSPRSRMPDQRHYVKLLRRAAEDGL